MTDANELINEARYRELLNDLKHIKRDIQDLRSLNENDNKQLRYELFGTTGGKPNGGGRFGEIARSLAILGLGGEQRDAKLEISARKLDELEDRLDRAVMWQRPKWLDVIFVIAAITVFAGLILQIFVVVQLVQGG